MPYTAAHGPPSLDAVHAWANNVLSLAPAPPQLNHRASDPPVYPWIKVLRITGWRALPEADDHREPRTTDDGEIGYTGRLLGKTVVYECDVRARTREDVQLLMNSCVQGFGERNLQGTMTITPYTVPGGPQWQYQARVLSLDPDPEWSYVAKRPWRFSWGFALSLRMLNPRFYTPNLAGTPYL